MTRPASTRPGRKTGDPRADRPSLVVELSDGSRVTVPNDGHDRRSYWGRASTCTACYVGKLHTDCN